MEVCKHGIYQVQIIYLVHIMICVYVLHENVFPKLTGLLID